MIKENYNDLMFITDSVFISVISDSSTKPNDDTFWF